MLKNLPNSTGNFSKKVKEIPDFQMGDFESTPSPYGKVEGLNLSVFIFKIQSERELIPHLYNHQNV